MSINEILELSSILQNDERAKSELERKNVTLISAIEQNESRLQREVDEKNKYSKHIDTLIKKLKSHGETVECVVCQVDVANQNRQDLLVTFSLKEKTDIFNELIANYHVKLNKLEDNQEKIRLNLPSIYQLRDKRHDLSIASQESNLVTLRETIKSTRENINCILKSIEEKNQENNSCQSHLENLLKESIETKNQQESTLNMRSEHKLNQEKEIERSNEELSDCKNILNVKQESNTSLRAKAASLDSTIDEMKVDIAKLTLQINASHDSLSEKKVTLSSLVSQVVEIQTTLDDKKQLIDEEKLRSQVLSSTISRLKWEVDCLVKSKEVANNNNNFQVTAKNFEDDVRKLQETRDETARQIDLVQKERFAEADRVAMEQQEERFSQMKISLSENQQSLAAVNFRKDVAGEEMSRLSAVVATTEVELQEARLRGEERSRELDLLSREVDLLKAEVGIDPVITEMSLDAQWLEEELHRQQQEQQLLDSKASCETKRLESLSLERKQRARWLQLQLDNYREEIAREVRLGGEGLHRQLAEKDAQFQESMKVEDRKQKEMEKNLREELDRLNRDVNALRQKQMERDEDEEEEEEDDEENEQQQQQQQQQQQPQQSQQQKQQNTPDDLWEVVGGSQNPHTPYEDYRAVKKRTTEQQQQQQQLKPAPRKILLSDKNNNNDNNSNITNIKSVGRGSVLSQSATQQVSKSVGRGKTVARMRA